MQRGEKTAHYYLLRALKVLFLEASLSLRDFLSFLYFSYCKTLLSMVMTDFMCIVNSARACRPGMFIIY